MKIFYNSSAKKTIVREHNGIPHILIQAELYRQLKKNGIDVELEYEYEHCKFDLIVFEEKIPRFVIEVKRYKFRKLTLQIQKYSQYDTEIIFVEGWNDITNCVNYILGLTQTHEKKDLCYQQPKRKRRKRKIKITQQSEI